MITAEVICDSISEQGYRLLSMKVVMHRFVLAEFNTHRMFSRNFQSSRAIPTSKLLEQVRLDALRAAPVFWGKNQSGMQAAEELNNFPEKGYYSRRTAAIDEWSHAAHSAALHAERLMDIGAHKQIVNRLLEPFLFVRGIVTSTDDGYNNFFGLRLHRDAQPEMRALAIAMWEARKASTPELLMPGEWHLPFIDDEIDGGALQAYQGGSWPIEVVLENCIKVSVARCARVSYESFETGKRSTVEEDLRLYDRLVGAQPMHASPAEHQATPDIWIPEQAQDSGYGSGCDPYPAHWQNSKQHGNFVGWRQFRQLLSGQACAPIPEEFR